MNDEYMEPLEVFTVESEDVEGAKKYEEVIKDVLADLGLVRAISKLKVYVDPKEPVFIIVGIFRPGLPTLTLGDIADLLSVNEGISVSISNEQFASKVVGKLFMQYGRENVIQTDRTSLIIPFKGDFATQVDELSSIVVYNPREELKKNVIEALIRITPEGFRVRKHHISDKVMAFIASEDIIKPEWVEICNKMRKSIGAVD
jgi:putative methanogenesis marker protein 17